MSFCFKSLKQQWNYIKYLTWNKGSISGLLTSINCFTCPFSGQLLHEVKSGDNSQSISSRETGAAVGQDSSELQTCVWPQAQCKLYFILIYTGNSIAIGIHLVSAFENHEYWISRNWEGQNSSNDPDWHSGVTLFRTLSQIGYADCCLLVFLDPSEWMPNPQKIITKGFCHILKFWYTQT